MRCPTKLLIACLLAGGAVAAAEPPKGLALGDDLPTFNLPGVDGKRHIAKEYADAKVLVLMFTCNHCPTAQAYEDRIIKKRALNWSLSLRITLRQCASTSWDTPTWVTPWRT